MTTAVSKLSGGLAVRRRSVVCRNLRYCDRSGHPNFGQQRNWSSHWVPGPLGFSTAWILDHSGPRNGMGPTTLRDLYPSFCGTSEMLV
ncbi:hypothetical protein VP1G_11427 [Cytospora mali]|uniref:Uncharacterized protein n=1 Tax=Cytospora mali TaxID=578113 RepID=A0A194VFF8_CYTMA|nr:hypothetical protein VP1G_11427 [Valsa mali var. pyri (nom. inval.)]